MKSGRLLAHVAGRLRSTIRGIQTLPMRRKLSTCRRLHLGCGRHVLDGWANLDLLDVPGIIRWDLRAPLPVPDGTIEYVFCEHFIEHLSREEGRHLLKECRRVLGPSGVLRLSTPDLNKLIDEYRVGRLTEWHDVGWRPQTPCQMMNEGMRLWGHQFLYNEAELRRLLTEAGFAGVSPVEWRRSEHEALRDLECRPYHREILLEAVR